MVLILTHEYFTAHLKWIYEHVFSGRPVIEGCFRNPGWSIAFLPGGLAPDLVQLRALAAAATGVGDSDYVITEVECIPAHGESALLPWTEQALEYVRDTTVLQMSECAMFGLSRRWGAVVGIVGEECTCIGGDEEFMRVFISEAGGRETLRERFLDFAATEWLGSEEDKAKVISLVRAGDAGTSSTT